MFTRGYYPWQGEVWAVILLTFFLAQWLCRCFSGLQMGNLRWFSWSRYVKLDREHKPKDIQGGTPSWKRCLFLCSVYHGLWYSRYIELARWLSYNKIGNHSPKESQFLEGVNYPTNRHWATKLSTRPRNFDALEKRGLEVLVIKRMGFWNFEGPQNN